MAHGTPSSLDEMPEYLTLVRGGRPPSPSSSRRCATTTRAIGGRSPLTDITLAQADGAARRGSAPTSRWPSACATGARSSRTRSRSSSARASTRIVGIPLAPQFSTLSVQKYLDAAPAALPAGVAFEPIRSFHDHPLLLDAFAERVRAARRRAGRSASCSPRTPAASASSTRAIVYADEVAATARGVADAERARRSTRVAYQSAGRTPEPWIGPDARRS